jgi:hypothetical protein
MPSSTFLRELLGRMWDGVDFGRVMMALRARLSSKCWGTRLLWRAESGAGITGFSGVEQSKEEGD